MTFTQPYLITLPKNSGKNGQLSFVQESRDFPIEIKRVYWIYEVEQGAERGNHAHLNSDRVIFCVSGSAEIKIENNVGEMFNFKLDHPWQAVFFPRNHWIHIDLKAGSVLVTLASCLFEDDVVEKDYNKFKQSVLS